MKRLILLCVLFSIAIFGCGSDTAGVLLVDQPTASNGVVTAVAKFSPSLIGQTINFRWKTVGVTTKTESPEIASSGKTDSEGVVSSQLTLPVDRSESFIVYVIASTGDLTNREGWRSVTVAP